jgi:hypothetical protein
MLKYGYNNRSLSQLSTLYIYMVNCWLPKEKKGLLSPPHIGGTGGGPLLKDMA